ncbi:hypothetical protein OSTOST_10673 [Ostertagia ostertagi]
MLFVLTALSFFLLTAGVGSAYTNCFIREGDTRETYEKYWKEVNPGLVRLFFSTRRRTGALPTMKAYEDVNPTLEYSSAKTLQSQQVQKFSPGTHFGCNCGYTTIDGDGSAVKMDTTCIFLKK